MEINDFPNEIMLEIFLKCVNIKQFCQLRKVCQKWKDIIDDEKVQNQFLARFLKIKASTHINGNHKLAAAAFFIDDGDIKKYHGTSLRYFPSGRIKSVGNWSFGKKEGTFIDYYRNGSVKAMKTFVNNKLHGEYTRYYQIKNDSKNRISNEENESILPKDLESKRFEFIQNSEQIQNGTIENQNLSHISNIDKKIDPPSKHKLGQVESITMWVYGKKSGLEKHFFTDGSICSNGYYINGSLNGTFEFYDRYPFYCLVRRMKFVFGQAHGLEEIWRNGFYYRIPWKFGLIDGNEEIHPCPHIMTPFTVEELHLNIPFLHRFIFTDPFGKETLVHVVCPDKKMIDSYVSRQENTSNPLSSLLHPKRFDSPISINDKNEDSSMDDETYAKIENIIEIRHWFLGYWVDNKGLLFNQESEAWKKEVNLSMVVDPKNISLDLLIVLKKHFTHLP